MDQFCILITADWVPVYSAFEQALQKCVADLSEDDKAAFKSAEDVMRKIQLLNKVGSKLRLESGLSDRVQKVLDFVRQFTNLIQTFVRYSPEISSLAVGGVNCVLSVGYSLLNRAPGPLLMDNFLLHLACFRIF